MTAGSKKKTPIRSSLKPASSLHDMVRDGIKALKKIHRKYLAEEIRNVFSDSLDLDEAMRENHGLENRWDYLLGYTEGAKVVALEPHSAKQDEIRTIIRKKEAAMRQLRGHLKRGNGVALWIWVASGTVHFADTEKARRRLDQNGIQFVGKKVLLKNLRYLNR